jgi:hypothetical protein
MVHTINTLIPQRVEQRQLSCCATENNGGPKPKMNQQHLPLVSLAPHIMGGINVLRKSSCASLGSLISSPLSLS